MTNEIRDEKTVRSRKSQSTAPEAKVFRSIGVGRGGGVRWLRHFGLRRRREEGGQERRRREKVVAREKELMLKESEENWETRVGDVASSPALICF
ncbi:hypothetical protein Droror1_Dr00006028 [Drosera rotundifolia]